VPHEYSVSVKQLVCLYNFAFLVAGNFIDELRLSCIYDCSLIFFFSIDILMPETTPIYGNARLTIGLIGNTPLQLLLF
jgi:hypothetical protein